jgi:hypothetical protein
MARLRRDGRRAPAAAALVAALALGCSSPQQKLVRSVEDSASWAATARLVAAAWAANSVPTAYARSALESARRSLQKQRETLMGSARELPAEHVAVAVGLISRAESVVGNMEAAVSRGDRPRLVHEYEPLPELEQRLRALLQAAGGSS